MGWYEEREKWMEEWGLIFKWGFIMKVPKIYHCMSAGIRFSSSAIGIGSEELEH